MALDYYIRSGQKQLRCGYTTGTCAALAAAGAAEFFLSGKKPETLSLMTPKGIPVETAPRFSIIKGRNSGLRCGKGRRRRRRRDPRPDH